MTTRDPIVEPERSRTGRRLRVLIDVCAVGSVVGLGLLVLAREAPPSHPTQVEPTRPAVEVARSTHPIVELPTESAARGSTTATARPPKAPAAAPTRVRPRPPAPPFATPRPESTPTRARAQAGGTALRRPGRRAGPPIAAAADASFYRVEVEDDAGPTTVGELVEELGRLLRHPCAGPRVRALYSEAHRTLERDEPADVTRDLVKDGRAVLASVRRACELEGSGESRR